MTRHWQRRNAHWLQHDARAADDMRVECVVSLIHKDLEADVDRDKQDEDVVEDAQAPAQCIASAQDISDFVVYLSWIRAILVVSYASQ